jgi:hypothetical protein
VFKIQSRGVAVWGAPLVLATWLLPAHAANDETDREFLRLLSCHHTVRPDSQEEPAAATLARNRLNALFNARGERQTLLATGPLHAAGVCVKNLDGAAAFGVQLMSGELCNANLKQAVVALTSIDLPLTTGAPLANKESGVGIAPEDVIYSADTAALTYLVVRGRIDLQGGITYKKTSGYSYFCITKGGRAQ